MLFVCNGFQRSGSTLQHQIVLALLKDKDCTDLGFFDRDDLLQRAQELEEAAQSPSLFALKTHSKLSNELLSSSKIIYSHRDIRDVAVSLYTKLDCERDVMLNMLDSCIEAYYALNAVQKDSLLTQTYTQLRHELKFCITELGSFLDTELTDQNRDLIYESLNIESVAERLPKFPAARAAILKSARNMRIGSFLRHFGLSVTSIEKYKILVKAGRNPGSFHYNHVSQHKGKIGLWTDKLDPIDVAIIEDQYGNWLRELGYMSEPKE